jgi:predicted nuclease of predicted toxin-antitoxin system
LTAKRPRLRVLLDEGVPAGVAKVFEEYGHEAILLEKVVKLGSEDVLVCTAAVHNEAILVAFDKDMKQLAKQHGIGQERFKRLSLIRFECSETMAAERLSFAMSLIEHEWRISNEKAARRLHVVIGTHVLRSYR